MNGLGGLNKSPNGVVIGLVQLQLPTVTTKADLEKQTQRIVAMVGTSCGFPRPTRSYGDAQREAAE